MTAETYVWVELGENKGSKHRSK